MRSRVRIVSCAAVAIALSLMAYSAQPAEPPSVQRAPATSVLRADQLNKQQFKALPDTAVIQLKDGTQTTAGQFRTIIWQRDQAALAQAPAQAAEAQARFQAYHARFLQEQKAKLDAENAKLQAEFARLKMQKSTAVAAPPQHQAIQQEALQLLNAAKTASLAEQVQIEQRADQLLQQLHQLEQAPQ